MQMITFVVPMDEDALMGTREAAMPSLQSHGNHIEDNLRNLSNYVWFTVYLLVYIKASQFVSLPL